MRKQYHFRPSRTGFHAWDVDRLLGLAAKIEPRDVQLSAIREMDEPYWFGSAQDAPTCRAIAEHARLINDADLSHPIILSSDGRVMDGMHRVVKAFLGGHSTITAVTFTEDPEPDHTDVQPDDLQY